MHRNHLIVAALAAAAMSACGKNPEQVAAASAASAQAEDTARAADGSVAQSGGPAAAIRTPSYASIYPGGVIGSSVTGASGSSSGGTVMFTSKAKPAEIIAFYQRAAKAAGLGTTFSSQSGGALLFNASKEGGEEGVQIIATPVGAETSVQIFWTDPKKG